MLMEVHCSSCGMRLRIDQKFAGRKGRCPNCKQKMIIPAVDARGVLLLSDEAAARAAEEAPQEPGEQGPAPSEEPVGMIYVLPEEPPRRYKRSAVETFVLERKALVIFLAGLAFLLVYMAYVGVSAVLSGTSAAQLLSASSVLSLALTGVGIGAIGAVLAGVAYYLDLALPLAEEVWEVLKESHIWLLSAGAHGVGIVVLGFCVVWSPRVRDVSRIPVRGRFAPTVTLEKMVELPVKEEPRPKMEDILTSTNPLDANTTVKPVVGDVTGLPNIGPAVAGGNNTGPPVIGLDVAGAAGGWSSLGGSGRGFTPGSTGVGRSQTAFFGNKAKKGAESIVFIIDASTTMGQIGNRFERALTELRSSIEKLTAGHRFNIIFFSDQCLKWQEHMTVASPENKRSALEFVESMREFKGSGTLPVPPMKEAINEDPEVIFLLTDGDFLSDDSAELLAMCKEKKIRVYPIGFGEKVNEPLLQKLADQSGGLYTAAKM